MSEPPPRSPRLRRRMWLAGALLLPAAIYGYSWLSFPSDRTPKGAYLRIVKAVNQGKAREFFAYTEEKAQHACFTIRDYRKRARTLVEADFPPEARKKWQARHGAVAAAEHGADVFAHFVLENGWLDQLRLDVSGVEEVIVRGERATIRTSQGARYAMRRRPNGIWGLTAFTPVLVEEAERAARDLDVVEQAAEDYRRAQ